MSIIIDADAHVTETPDLFTSRLPSKWADAVPHIKHVPEMGVDMWFIGDTPVQHAAMSVIENRPDGRLVRREIEQTEGWGTFPKTFDAQHPSSYDPNERVKVMDAFGIRAATTYPNLGLLGPDIYRQIPGVDLDFQLQVVAAYNDWVLSWAQAQPGRFIPLGCIPYWDADGAVKEIERCAEIGIKGMVMSGKPQNHGCPILPDPYWDPIWSACQAANFSISFHAGGGGLEGHYEEKRLAIMGNEAIQVYVTAALLYENAISAVDLLSSGVLQRFPQLHFAIVETGVGWVPFALEALDHHYKRYTPWRSRPEMKEDELPSELFRRQVFVNVWFENVAPLRGSAALENVMFETDYPHPTCLLAEDIDDAVSNGLSSLDEKELERVMWKNAMRCFNLELADVGL